MSLTLPPVNDAIHAKANEADAVVAAFTTTTATTTLSTGWTASEIRLLLVMKRSRRRSDLRLCVWLTV